MAQERQEKGMKRTMTALLLISMVLCQTGCGGSVQDVSHSLPDATTNITEPPITTEAVSSLAENSREANLAEEIVPFESYEAFSAMMQEKFPDKYLYQLPEDSGFRIDTVSLHDNAFYDINLSSESGQHASLEIVFETSFETVEDIQKSFGGINVDGNTFHIESPQFLFEHYASGAVAMYGLTGEKPTFFTLLDTRTDKPEDTGEQEAALVALYQALGL